MNISELFGIASVYMKMSRPDEKDSTRIWRKPHHPHHIQEVMLWILAFWTPKKESKRDKTWNPMWNYWDCHEHSRTFLILWVLIMAHCTWCPCRIHWPSTPATKDAMCATVPTVSLPEPQTLWTLLQHVGSTGEAAQVSSVRMGWVGGEITSAVCTCAHTHTALDAMLHLQWVGVKFHENLLTLLSEAGQF